MRVFIKETLQITKLGQIIEKKISLGRYRGNGAFFILGKKKVITVLLENTKLLREHNSAKYTST